MIIENKATTFTENQSYNYTNFHILLSLVACGTKWNIESKNTKSKHY